MSAGTAGRALGLRCAGLICVPGHQVPHYLGDIPPARVPFDGSGEGLPQVRLKPERVARVPLRRHGGSPFCRDTYSIQRVRDSLRD